MWQVSKLDFLVTKWACHRESKWWISAWTCKEMWIEWWGWFYTCFGVTTISYKIEFIEFHQAYQHLKFKLNEIKWYYFWILFWHKVEVQDKVENEQKISFKRWVESLCYFEPVWNFVKVVEFVFAFVDSVAFATERMRFNDSLKHAPLAPDFVESVRLYFLTSSGDGWSGMTVHSLQVENEIIQMIIQISRTIIWKVIILGL